MSPSDSKKRRCLRDSIRDAIVTRILDGSYPPNTHLKELALAAEFKVSQTPVREALRELEILGMVTTKQFCGTKVRPLELTDLYEAYELRAVIEQRAAQLATPCNPQALELLGVEVDRMQISARTQDSEGYAAAAFAFHRLLVEQSGNRLFLWTWDCQHWEVRTRVSTHLVVQAGRRLSHFADRHAQILQLLRQGNGQQAGSLVRETIESLFQGAFVPA
jgi:DNA-binding GntR family transcriptional regulator